MCLFELWAQEDRVCVHVFTFLFAMALRVSKAEESVKLYLRVDGMSWLSVCVREDAPTPRYKLAGMLPSKKFGTRYLMTIVFPALNDILDRRDQQTSAAEVIVGFGQRWQPRGSDPRLY